MKPIKSILVLAALASSSFIFAQKPITVSEDSIPFGVSKLPGLAVTIPQVNYDKTQKNWIKELQSGTKSKIVDEGGEMTIFGAYIKDISPNPINIYSKLMNQDSLLRLLVSLELKKDQYISRSSGDAELTAAKAFLKDFAKDQYIDFVKDELQVEDKKLKDLNNELNKLQNDKSRMQKSIQTSRTTITAENDNIVLQNNEVTKVTAELLEQNNQLSSMEEGAAREEKATYIKDLEKRKKKLLNDIESSENKIRKANNEINDCDRDIPKNESEQETLRGKIAQQEGVVQKFTDKLNNVKAF